MPHASTLFTNRPAEQECEILLQPVSPPELQEIYIKGDLFAIGRTESPFDKYPREIVSDLSRRHARIFSEDGTAYLADLGSKNGTTVNGVNVQQRITRLQDGDEISFASKLTFKVRLAPCSRKPERGTRLDSVLLTPQDEGQGLQPIVISSFPFLISKTDETFARYKQGHAQQVNYLSRRHAHIFVRGDVPYIEDLGSTNGTFLDGKRLDERARPLTDGAILAFGGHHFVYKVQLLKHELEFDPTVTKLAAFTPQANASSKSVGKTTFITSAGSFLDIFCIDPNAGQEHETNANPQQQGSPEEDAAAQSRSVPKERPGRLRLMLASLSGAWGAGETKTQRASVRWAAILALSLVALVSVFVLFRTPEAEMKELLANKKYAQAAVLAHQYLPRHPDNLPLRSLGTEALLRYRMPDWINFIRAKDFPRAEGVLVEMKKLGQHNAEVQPLLQELEWLGKLEEFVTSRGGASLPAQNQEDADQIGRFLQQWHDDTARHQLAFATLSVYAPEFNDAYTEVLSHVRQLALASSQKKESG